MAEVFKNKNSIGVSSRNTIKGTIMNPDYAIINLGDSIGPGTHWVCYYNNYYFDPFGMPHPIEIVKYIQDIKI